MAETQIPGLEDLELIGRGGYSRVYRGRQPAFGREVAVKVVSFEVDDATVDRFRRECVAVGRLSGHPNIVNVHDAGTTDSGDPYIVMELLAGGSIGARLRDAVMPWPEAAAVVVQVARGLGAAHRAGVIHCDVKPENILISEYGEPKLADFGIARLEDALSTREGVVTATLAHAAPEVLDGKPPTVVSDVYSLSSTFVAMVRGRPPFVEPTDEGIVPMLARIAKDPPPDLVALGLPAAVAEVVTAGLAKDPAARPTSADELATRLEAAASSAGVDLSKVTIGVSAPGRRGDTGGAPHRTTQVAPLSASPSSPSSPPITPDEPARAPRRGRAVAAAVAVLALVVVATIVVVRARAGDRDAGTAEVAAPVSEGGAAAPVEAVALGVDSSLRPWYFTEQDGRWVPHAIAYPGDVFDLAWNGERWIAVGRGQADRPAVLSSAAALDGGTPQGDLGWTIEVVDQPGTLFGVASNGEQWVAVGGDVDVAPEVERSEAVVLTSPDGRAWERRAVGARGVLAAVAWNGTSWVAVGSSDELVDGQFVATPLVLTSPDGITWTPRPLGWRGVLAAVAWTGETWVVVGSTDTDDPVVATSADGATWTRVELPGRGRLTGIGWSGSKLVAVGRAGPRNSLLLTSDDGTAWQRVVIDLDGWLDDVAWAGDRWIAVGGAGDTEPVVLTSADAASWQRAEVETGVGGRVALSTIAVQALTG